MIHTLQIEAPSHVRQLGPALANVRFIPYIRENRRAANHPLHAVRSDQNDGVPRVLRSATGKKTADWPSLEVAAGAFSPLAGENSGAWRLCRLAELSEGESHALLRARPGWLRPHRRPPPRLVAYIPFLQNNVLLMFRRHGHPIELQNPSACYLRSFPLASGTRWPLLRHRCATRARRRRATSAPPRDVCAPCSRRGGPQNRRNAFGKAG